MTFQRPIPLDRTSLAIVLGAGNGTRMRSLKPKILHEVAGRSMVGHVLDAIRAAGIERIAVVVGPDREDVAKEVRRHAPAAVLAVQHDRRGTAHAVLAARDEIARGEGDLLVAFADTPLVTPETLGRLKGELKGDVAVAVLGFRAAEPFGYGRLVMNGGHLTAIREEKDASEAERAITLCNAGLMALSGRHALRLLEQIGNSNAKGEFYLTDVVELAERAGLASSVVIADEEEVMGVNDRAQLAQAEAALQKRLRAVAMAGGATLISPETVFLSADTRIGQDVIVEPHVFIGPGVIIEDAAVIHAFSHLEGARVGPGASVGPFARLRPGAHLGVKARVGNFVEMKNTTLGDGAKANHLTYLGDATIGTEVNIGAGTITCNYDGFGKFRTVVGDGAFVGSNSSLVAPVSIGAGAFIASGSVITSDVPEDSLAVARGRQEIKLGWAANFRDKRTTPKS